MIASLTKQKIQQFQATYTLQIIYIYLEPVAILLLGVLTW